MLTNTSQNDCSKQLFSDVMNEYTESVGQLKNRGK